MYRWQFLDLMKQVKSRIGKRKLERTVQEAWSIHAQREHDALRLSSITAVPSLIERLTRRYIRHIERQGLPTEIRDQSSSSRLRICSRADGLTLLRCEGWRYYSRRTPSRYARLAYLCGRTDNGLFAARVPGTVTTVAAALEALEPAEVRRAREDGRQVLRQGDIYVYQLRNGRDNFRGLWGTNHEWDAANRTVRHNHGNPHAALHVPFAPAKAVAQNVYNVRRGRRGVD